MLPKDVVGEIYDAYLRHVQHYLEGTDIFNEHTCLFEYPNEQFMRSIEEEMHIPEQAASDFRKDFFVLLADRALHGLPVVGLKNASTEMSNAVRRFAKARKMVDKDGYLVSVP